MLLCPFFQHKPLSSILLAQHPFRFSSNLWSPISYKHGLKQATFWIYDRASRFISHITVITFRKNESRCFRKEAFPSCVVFDELPKESWQILMVAIGVFCIQSMMTFEASGTVILAISCATIEHYIAAFAMALKRVTNSAPMGAMALPKPFLVRLG